MTIVAIEIILCCKLLLLIYSIAIAILSPTEQLALIYRTRFSLLISKIRQTFVLWNSLNLIRSASVHNLTLLLNAEISS